MTDVTGDDRLLLGRGHAEGVVDHRLLHWVHLQGGTHTNTYEYVSLSCFLFLASLDQGKNTRGVMGESVRFLS